MRRNKLPTVRPDFGLCIILATLALLIERDAMSSYVKTFVTSSPRSEDYDDELDDVMLDFEEIAEELDMLSVDAAPEVLNVFSAEGALTLALLLEGKRNT